ncbi:MAG: hypothetical protein H0T51_07175 [Pirellulales bacterium]|nr:hypothetical protein [Pirellulales bacterium]
MIQRLISRLLPLAAILFIGCGGGSELLPVTGTVKNADGAAVSAEEGGQVLFNPDGSGTPASGIIEKDGSFTMMTQTPGDGVKPGKYKVVLQLWENYRAGTLAVPEKYGDAATTPLEATVDAENDHFDFVVEP